MLIPGVMLVLGWGGGAGRWVGPPQFGTHNLVVLKQAANMLCQHIIIKIIFNRRLTRGKFAGVAIVF